MAPPGTSCSKLLSVRSSLPSGSQCWLVTGEPASGAGFDELHIFQTGAVRSFRPLSRQQAAPQNGPNP